MGLRDVRYTRPSLPTANHHHTDVVATSSQAVDESALHPFDGSVRCFLLCPLLPPADPCRSWKQAINDALIEMDFQGLLLMAASLALILLPLGLAPAADQGWKNPIMVSTCSLSLVCIMILPLPLFATFIIIASITDVSSP